MKHLHTFESFLNEATTEGIVWDPNASIMDGSTGLVDGLPSPMGRSPYSSAGLYWDPFDDEVVGFWEGSGGRIVYKLGVKCGKAAWASAGPKIAEELNSIHQNNPKALVGFAGKKKANPKPEAIIIDVLKKYCK